jgi:hypothetical protein
MLIPTYPQFTTLPRYLSVSSWEGHVRLCIGLFMQCRADAVSRSVRSHEFPYSKGTYLRDVKSIPLPTIS